MIRRELLTIFYLQLATYFYKEAIDCTYIKYSYRFQTYSMKDDIYIDLRWL